MSYEEFKGLLESIASADPNGIEVEETLDVLMTDMAYVEVLARYAHFMQGTEYDDSLRAHWVKVMGLG